MQRSPSCAAQLLAEQPSAGPSDEFPLAPERILADVRAELPAEAILVTDVGWNKNGVAQCYQLPADGTFITPGGASTMGFGPAAAVGVAARRPGQPVVALIGDGGMSAQLSAMPMAVEQGVEIIFVVMNNRAHGTIAGLQQSHFGRGYGCDFNDPDGEPYKPDFAAFARACGARRRSRRAGRRAQGCASRCAGRRRPAVIDVPMVNEPVPTPGHWNIKDIYQGVF